MGPPGNEEYDPCTRATAEEAERDDFPAMTLAAAAARARGEATPADAAALARGCGEAAPALAKAKAKAAAPAAPAKAKAKAKAPVAPSRGPAAAGAAAEKDVQRFTVDLSRGGQPDFGFLVTPVGARALELHSVRPGTVGNPTAIGSWNMEAVQAGRPQLRTGDLITSFNDARGDIEDMWKRWKEDTVIRCEVFRPSEITVRVLKNGPLNINIQSGEVSLFLDGVGTGPFTAWNEEHREQQVRKGDRIVAVNGKRLRAPQLLEALKAATGTLELVVALGPAEHRQPVP